MTALKDKVVIITGSTRGIGRTLAAGFAKEGARVVVCGRSSSSEPGAISVEQTAREVER